MPTWENHKGYLAEKGEKGKQTKEREESGERTPHVGRSEEKK